MIKILQHLAICIIISAGLISCGILAQQKVQSSTLYAPECNMKFEYEASTGQFFHTMKPWEEFRYKSNGNFSFNANSFNNIDNRVTKINSYQLKKYITFDALYEAGYRSGGVIDETWTQEALLESWMMSAKFSPWPILNYLKSKGIKWQSDNMLEASFENWNIVIEKEPASHFIKTIRITSNLEIDDQYYGFGDVLTTFHYSNYIQDGCMVYPNNIITSKLDGKLLDTVRVLRAMMVNASYNSFDTLIADRPPKETKDQITVEQYSNNIHFINLHHCGTRSLVVDLGDHLFISESPLNSKYGTQLLSEVRKIYPSKPIKYLAFGHFHPHYTGGIRPFVHEGATVLMRKSDEEFINHILNQPHRILPDKLQESKRPLRKQFLGDSLTLGSGAHKMVIYHIGKKSNHTLDYLLYYFPKEKLVFQGDLVWLSSKSNRKNLSPTTRGFYSFAKELNIEIDTIAQSWGVFTPKQKMKFSFDRLEQIMLEE